LSLRKSSKKAIFLLHNFIYYIKFFDYTRYNLTPIFIMINYIMLLYSLWNKDYKTVWSIDKIYLSSLIP